MFQEQARNWAKFFRVVHFDEDVTPYVHGKFITLVECNYLQEEKKIHVAALRWVYQIYEFELEILSLSLSFKFELELEFHFQVRILSLS